MTSSAPAVGLPPPRLQPVASDRRKAILAAVAAPERPDAVCAWVEKVQRFASLHRNRLRRVAYRRFGTEASVQLSWMARLLLEGSVRCRERAAAPVDVRCLNAALYALAAMPQRDAALAAMADRAFAAAREWAVTREQPPVLPALGCGFSFLPGRWRVEAAVVPEVVMLAPMAGSLYAVAVLELCRRLGVPVAGVVLRRFTVSRFRSEWRRDGSRLLRKIRRKLILGRDEYPDPADTSLASVIERLSPATRDLRQLAWAMGVPVRHVVDFGDAADDPAVTGRKIGLFTGGGILPPPLLDAFHAGVINVHGGHLPRYRGRDAVAAAVLDGCPASIGLTAHCMTPEIDGGDVLTRYDLDPGRYATAGALGNALAGIMPLMLVDAALGVASGRLRRIAQQNGACRHYVLHPRLRPVVDDALACRHARRGGEGPSPAARLLDAVLADLAR